MAIALVQTLTPTTAVGNTTHTDVTPSASTTAGNLLVLALVAQGNDVISSVTDTQGNTWTVGPTTANGTNEGLSIAYTVQDVAGLTGADTITVSHTTSPGRIVSIDEFSGVDTTTPTTGSAGTATGTSTGPSATMAGATTDADAMVYGAFGYNGTTGFTAGSGYTGTSETEVVNGSVHRKLATEYQIVAATSAYAADGTLGASAVWTAAVMAFKAAAGGGGPTMFTQECDVSLTVNDTSKPYRIRSHQSTTVGVTASRLNLTRSKLSASLATAMAAVRRVGAIRSVGLGTTASLSRLTRKLLSASLGTLATLATNLISGALHFTQECATTIGTSVSQQLLTRKVISGSASVSASVGRRVSAIRSASLSVSASVVRLTRKYLSASLATAASVATLLRTGPIQFLQECAVSLGTGVSLLKRTRVAHGASASLAASTVRRVGVAKTVSVALSASRRLRVQSIRSVSLATTASVRRRISKQLSTSLSTLWSVIRARITGPKNDPQVQSITVDTSLNSVNVQGSANTAEVYASANSVRVLSSPNTFEVTDG